MSIVFGFLIGSLVPTALLKRWLRRGQRHARRERLLARLELARLLQGCE